MGTLARTTALAHFSTTLWRSIRGRDKLSDDVLSVVATKIRSSSAGASAYGPSARDYRGYLLAVPVVGRGMVIFRDSNGRRMVTTAVRRVLATSEANVLYVETENSVYRLSIRDEQFAAVG